MKRKIILTLALGTLALSSLAHATCANSGIKWCNWHDNFHFDTNPPAGSRVMAAASTDFVATFSPNTIDLSDKGDCISFGNATATVGIDQNNMCQLSIRDGSLQDTPDVTANCVGNYHYNGITYDGIFTYRYTLHFSTTK